jgi:hypothetical protein
MNPQNGEPFSPHRRDEHEKSLRQILKVWVELLGRPDLAALHPLARQYAGLYTELLRVEQIPTCRHCGAHGETHDACDEAWRKHKYLAKSEADAERHIANRAQQIIVWRRGDS